MIFNKSNPTVKVEGINEIDLETAKEKKTFRLLNIMLVFIMLIAIMISFDIVSTKIYNKGPHFAICMKTYNDGGSKVYYGLGYKVIKYNQKNGRKGMTVGLWTMPYNVDAKKIDILDLAIALRNYPKDTYNKYINEFVQITGQISEMKDNKVVLSYKDSSYKYSLNVICRLSKKEEISTELLPSSSAIVTGVVSSYTPKSKNDSKEVNTLELENCFVK